MTCLSDWNLEGRVLTLALDKYFSIALALDVLQTIRETISKVRESLKFVKYFESHEEKFVKLKK
ncbi:hypothetical protein RYX36_035120 [Vicia faba]